VLLPATVWWELRQREPLVQLRLFAIRNFCADSLVLAAVQFALTGVAVFGALWVQNVLGFSPIVAGLSLLPLTLPVLVIAPRAGALYDRIGPRAPVTVGSTLVAAALLWAALVLHHRDYAWLVPGYVLMGIGLGIMMTPANADAMNAVLPELRSQASGVLQTVRMVGATIGVAVMGTVVSNGQNHRIAHVVETRFGVPPRDVNVVERAINKAAASGASTHGIPHAFLQILSPLLDAVTAAVASAFSVAAGVMAAAALIALALLRHRRATDDPAPPGEGEDAASVAAGAIV
jgi:MFS family permease